MKKKYERKVKTRFLACLHCDDSRQEALGHPPAPRAGAPIRADRKRCLQKHQDQSLLLEDQGLLGLRHCLEHYCLHRVNTNPLHDASFVTKSVLEKPGSQTRPRTTLTRRKFEFSATSR